MIRGKTISNKRSINRNVDVKIHNRFDIEVIDAKSGVVKQRAFAENVICNQMFSRLVSSGSWNSYIHYGNGAGTPSSADTSLFGFIGYISLSTHNVSFDYDENVFQVTRKAVLSETDAVGYTLTEVGIAYSSTETTLCTHAMFQDMNGNPISIEKTSTDVINIYATVFCHLNLPNETVATGFHMVTIRKGNSENKKGYTGFLCSIAGILGWPGAYVQGSFGYVQNKSSVGMSRSYDETNKTVTFTATRLGINDWNVGGIKSLFLCSSGGDQSPYPPNFVFNIDQGNGWYEKTSIVGEPVGTGDGTTVDFATKFPYAKNATVYVDGVAVNSTVEYGYNYNSIGHYLRLLRMPEAAHYFSDGVMHDYDYYYSVLCSSAKGTFALFRPKFNSYAIFENVLYETCGISQLSCSNLNVQVSNDLMNWINLANNSYGSVNVPEEYQHYRYWGFYCGSESSSGYGFSIATQDVLPAVNNIHLASAPAEGAVITVDYDTYSIAKDENHVFDFNVTFSFGEYTEG